MGPLNWKSCTLVIRLLQKDYNVTESGLESSNVIANIEYNNKVLNGLESTFPVSTRI